MSTCSPGREDWREDIPKAPKTHQTQAPLRVRSQRASSQGTPAVPRGSIISCPWIFRGEGKGLPRTDLGGLFSGPPGATSHCCFGGHGGCCTGMWGTGQRAAVCWASHRAKARLQGCRNRGSPPFSAVAGLAAKAAAKEVQKDWGTFLSLVFLFVWFLGHTQQYPGRRHTWPPDLSMAVLRKPRGRRGSKQTHPLDSLGLPFLCFFCFWLSSRVQEVGGPHRASQPTVLLVSAEA